MASTQITRVLGPGSLISPNSRALGLRSLVSTKVSSFGSHLNFKDLVSRVLGQNRWQDLGSWILPKPPDVEFHFTCILFCNVKITVFLISQLILDLTILFCFASSSCSQVLNKSKGGVYGEKTSRQWGPRLSEISLIKELYCKIKICLYESELSHLRRIPLS